MKITNDPITAVLGANVLYTDVWSSMGEENQKEEKDKDFFGFTIDSDLVKMLIKMQLFFIVFLPIELKK